MKRHPTAKTVFIAIGFLIPFLLWGCKDSEQTDTASLLEQCKIYLDEGEWSDAAETCMDVETEEGYHYAAQAYMGLGDLSLFDLVKEMSDSSGGSSAGAAIFGFIPSTAEKRSYLATALGLLMGTSISNKTQTIYLEGLLVSSILVFSQLKDTFGLSEAEDGTLTTCDPDTADSCSFTVNLSGGTLTSTGIGSSFFTNLCCASPDNCTTVSSLTDTSQLVSPTVDYDVVIDYCTIESGSVLDYNKSAYDNYVVTDAFKDDQGKSVLDPLDFYALFDSGDRYDTSGDQVPICKSSFLSDVISDDQVIYDCEVMGAVFDENSELFN